MTTVLIAAYGSRGDIMPLTDIGVRLLRAGHEVVMTTNPDLVGDVEACGLQARAVHFDPGDVSRASPLAAAMQLVKPAGMRQLGHNRLSAITDVPADIVLLTPFAEIAGHAYAEARGIPSVGLRLQPMSATAAFPPSLLGAWSAGRLGDRMAGHAAAAGIDLMYGSVGARFRRELGLPRLSARRLRRRRTSRGWPILHGISPAVLPRPRDWRPGLEMVGYWWPRPAAGWTPDPELLEFLEAGAAPVVVGLGSLLLSADEPASLSATVHAALRRAGVRGIVQSGGAGLDVADDQVLTVGAVPHEWLFSRAAAVVHSCGAGTTAAAVRAGLPSIAVPSPGGDQPFWARRLHRLGVSTATLPRPTLTSGPLADAIARATGEPAYRGRAAAVSTRMAGEDGAARVVEVVEQLLDS